MISFTSVLIILFQNFKIIYGNGNIINYKMIEIHGNENIIRDVSDSRNLLNESNDLIGEFILDQIKKLAFHIFIIVLTLVIVFLLICQIIRFSFKFVELIIMNEKCLFRKNLMFYIVKYHFFFIDLFGVYSYNINYNNRN